MSGACRSPSKLPVLIGDLTPSNTWFLGSTRLSIPNGISISSAVFAQFTAECLYTLQWAAPFPQNCPFPWGGSGPHLIYGSWGPLESSTQTASGLTTVTDRPTDHATRSVTINRIYVRSTAMRPNNRVIVSWSIFVFSTAFWSRLHSVNLDTLQLYLVLHLSTIWDADNTVAMICIFYCDVSGLCALLLLLSK